MIAFKKKKKKKKKNQTGGIPNQVPCPEMT